MLKFKIYFLILMELEKMISNKRKKERKERIKITKKKKKKKMNHT